MSAEWICDGCGKRARADFGRDNWFKPRSWYARTDLEKRLHYDACSRECVDKVAQKEGCTSVVLPI